MRNRMYITLALIPLLAGCGERKETARTAMPVPEISVALPVVKDITLTKNIRVISVLRKPLTWWHGLTELCKPSPMLPEAG